MSLTFSEDQCFKYQKVIFKIFERAFHAFLRGYYPCTHLTERKREAGKGKLVAWVTQQADEGRAQNTELLGQNSKEGPLGHHGEPTRAGSPPGDVPPPSPRHSAPSQLLQAGGGALRHHPVQASGGEKRQERGVTSPRSPLKPGEAPGLGPRLPNSCP